MKALITLVAMLLFAHSALADPPIGVTAVERGATVATGGTAVSIAKNLGRKGGWVQNPCDATEHLFVSFTGSATTTSGTPNDADLAPCMSVKLGGAAGAFQGAVSINAATTGHKFQAIELQ